MRSVGNNRKQHKQHLKQLFLSGRGGSALASLGLARYKSRAPLTRRLPPCRPRTTDASERRPYQLAARNRPLRGFATRGEMRLRRSRQVGQGRRPSREAAARARANTPSEASAELRGVKKLFYKLFLLFPKPFYMLYMFYTAITFPLHALHGQDHPQNKNPRRFCRGR